MNRTIKFFLKTPYKSMTRQGIIPRQVSKKSAKAWLPGVWYPGELNSLGYHTARSQSHRVSYPGESWNQMFHQISPGSHTPASQAHRGHIPRRVSLPGVWDPGESLMTPASHSWPRGVNSHFLTHLPRPLKVHWHQNKCRLLFYY